MIGRRIYYDISSGDALLDTGERYGVVTSFSPEHERRIYKVLSDRTPESYDYIQLEYGQYAQDFVESISYRVNPETKMLEFSYPDPNAPVEPTPEPVYQAPLSEEVASLKQENTLLKAQNQALTERADFIEDVVAEMATRVY